MRSLVKTSQHQLQLQRIIERQDLQIIQDLPCIQIKQTREGIYIFYFERGKCLLYNQEHYEDWNVKVTLHTITSETNSGRCLITPCERYEKKRVAFPMSFRILCGVLTIEVGRDEQQQLLEPTDRIIAISISIQTFLQQLIDEDKSLLKEDYSEQQGGGEIIFKITDLPKDLPEENQMAMLLTVYTIIKFKIASLIASNKLENLNKTISFDNFKNENVQMFNYVMNSTQTSMSENQDILEVFLKRLQKSTVNSNKIILDNFRIDVEEKSKDDTEKKVLEELPFMGGYNNIYKQRYPIYKDKYMKYKKKYLKLKN